MKFAVPVERHWVVETLVAALQARARAVVARIVAPTFAESRRSRLALPPETLRVIGGELFTLAITIARIVFGAGVLTSMPVVGLAVAGATLVGLPTFLDRLGSLVRGRMPVIDTLIATACDGVVAAGRRGGDRPCDRLADRIW
jgi:hypothetical protein